nr:MAG TPA_asm: hypothetical protein [Caudoviricetes sp.]
MADKKKYTVKLNNIDKIEQLLQETYNLACQQFTQIQGEINKIANTTILKDLDIDGKEKYGKIMNNYISLQQKSITQKFDIAKLMSEIIKHNGDIDGALKDAAKAHTSLDIKSIRDIVNKAKESNDTQVYQLKG